MDRNEYNNRAMDKATKLMDELIDAGSPAADLLEEAIQRVEDAADRLSTQKDIDADIDAVVAIYNAGGLRHTIPARTAEQAFSGHPAPAAPAHPRDIYNQTILEEALSYSAQNGDDADTELDAQIDWVRQSVAARMGGADVAVHLDELVDHLRRMLTISYLDDEDLPTTFDRAEPLIEVTLRLPAVQAQALREAAHAVAQNTPDGNEARVFVTILEALKAAGL